MQLDRFAREIGGISAPSDAARLRRLMRSPLGRTHRRHWRLHCTLCGAILLPSRCGRVIVWAL